MSRAEIKGLVVLLVIVAGLGAIAYITFRCFYGQVLAAPHGETRTEHAFDGIGRYLRCSVN
jgi:hypothetical protein